MARAPAPAPPELQNQPELFERLAYLFVAQEEDVLRIGEESLPGKQRAELPDLVPEDRENQCSM